MRLIITLRSSCRLLFDPQISIGYLRRIQKSFFSMTLEEFKTSLSNHVPPANASGELTGLWWDGKNDWQKAHEAVQDLETQAAAWVHAYLHRKEGDIWNADYWYRRAGQVRPSHGLDEEWESIVKTLLH